MAPVSALGTRTYLPRASENVLTRIVETHLEELRHSYDERFAAIHGPLSPRVLDLFERFLRCGDPHFGFLRLRCEECGNERFLPFSCKARGLCPSCGRRRSLEWAERMVEDVLPEVPYVPLVFTIPKILRRPFLFRPHLYTDLCRTAYRVVREAFEARFTHLDRPVPAFLASSQSFGNLLNFHPHAHALASCGVFDHDGTFHPIDDVDFTHTSEALELHFRDALLDVMEKRGIIDDARASLVRSWEHSGFGVHTERLIEPGSRTELESLLQYMERAPVSLQRLTYLDTGMVHYQGRYHPGLGRDHQLTTGVEFLALLVPHIQHRYQCKIHTYGALSTTLRKRWGWIGQAPRPRVADSSTQTSALDPTAPDELDSPPTRRKRGWAHLIQKVWLDDPERCEHCGRTMKIIAAFSSPEQDDVIRAILQATGQWNPPWNRTPSATDNGPRSPPREPTIEYEVDPAQIWPDD